VEYNKKNQPFEILERFMLQEEEGNVEYCRVKFMTTGHEQVVRTELVKTGDFEDLSLVKEEVKEEVIEKAVEETPKQKIIAISPKGEEIEVEDLESFVAKHKLVLEDVKLVLEGKRKTHKKWGFKLV
jgi:hypothetical protein